MRRILSILLTLVLGSGPALAAVPAEAIASVWTGQVDESRLPACCRRHGTHHCSMGPGASQDELTAAGSATSVSAPDRCPLMPRAVDSTAPSVAALVEASATSLEPPSSLRAPRALGAASLMSDRRGWPKRGPPQVQTI